MFGLSVITASLLLTPASLAADQNAQRMTYEVYGSGFHVVDATFDVDFSAPESYHMGLTAYTRGFLGSVAPWKGTFETRGQVNPQTDIATPLMHQSSTVWEDELEKKEYLYGPGGSFKEYRVTDVHSDREVREVEQALTQGTTDLFTAALDIMNGVAAGAPCEGATQEIFDGKRRYRLIFRHKGEEELTQSRYNVYEGKTAKCEVEVEEVAGKWHKKPRGWMSIQEQSRKNGRLPTVWMAKLDPDSPAVPVKILVKTAYGAMMMHLVGYEGAATQLAFQDDES